ncbi:uncharacterized protein KZ484_025526 isoform 1-T4 [Pholidichthys leucotaenia]
MAEVVQEKSRGLKFAEQQLLRHGWEHGKGLGRAENGISEAIKVKIKCDKGGVGHKEGEQFTFHWWDHVFNKAASSLQVESDQDGIKLKKTTEDEEDGGRISNKKPRKAALDKAKLYGCFVKSATLLSGQEQPEPKPSDDDSSSSDDDEQRVDLSSTTRLSDADLMKACGGRTAHKGARHGLNMSAKLARLEQQEAEFMAKYGGNDYKKKSQSVNSATSTSSGSADELNGDNTNIKSKKKKGKGGDAEERTASDSLKTKKKHKKTKNGETLAETERLEVTTADEETHSKVKEKKKKSSKRHSEPVEEEKEIKESNQSDHMAQDISESARPPPKKKKKSSKRHSEPVEEGKEIKESNQSDHMAQEDVSESARPPSKKKKKKKSSKWHGEPVEEKEIKKSNLSDHMAHEDFSESARPPPKKKKKCKD